MVALNAKTGKVAWKEDSSTPTSKSSPLIVGKMLYIGTDSKQVLADRYRQVATRSGNTRRTPRSRRACPSTKAWTLRRQLPERDAGAEREDRQGRLADQHHQGVGRAGAASTPRPRSPSATSTPPATTASSSPSTARPARSRGPSPPGGAVYGSPAVAKVPGTPRDRLHRLRKRPPLRPPREQRRRALAPRRRRPDPRHRERHRQHRLQLQLRHPPVGRPRRPHPQARLHPPPAGYTPVVSDGHRLTCVGYYTFYGLEEVPGRSSRGGGDAFESGLGRSPSGHALECASISVPAS